MSRRVGQRKRRSGTTAAESKARQSSFSFHCPQTLSLHAHAHHSIRVRTVRIRVRVDQRADDHEPTRPEKSGNRRHPNTV
jgi:hypothetical protein